MATRLASQSEVTSTTLLRRCAGPCLLFVSTLVFPINSQAQLTVLTNDPYARLIFEPVPLPLANDGGNEDEPGAALLPDYTQEAKRLEASGNHEREAEYRSYLFLVQQSTYSPGDSLLIDASQAWAGWNLRKFQQDISANPHFFQLGDGKRPEEFVAWRDDRATEVRFIPRRDLDIRYVQRREVLLDPFTGIAEGGGSAIQENTRFSYSADMIMDYRLRQACETWKRLLESHADILDADTEEAIRINLIDADHSYRRQISETPDPVALARSLIRIGDVHLSFEQLSPAQQSYNKAWQVLQAAGLEEEQIVGLLNPQPLILAPEFISHQYSRSQFGIAPEDPIDYRGYIDVKLHISSNGDGKKITITQASKGTPQRVRSKLLDHLRAQKFRPHMADGVPVNANNINVRFFYHY